MRTKKTAYYVLMVLPLIVTLIALPFLPDQIPAHYNAAGLADRWGSKYETLILPVMVILFGLFMLFMARVAARKETSGQNNEKICLITGLCFLAVFDVMTFCFLYGDYRRVENLSEAALDLNQSIFGIMGIAMIVIGNVMPKLRRNSLIGLRTVWSTKNDTTWKKSQLFGGISFIIGGIAIVLLCLNTRGMACFWGAMGLLLLLIAVDVWYTYRVYRKY